MGIELRTAEPDDAPAMFAADGRAFGIDYADADVEQHVQIMDLSRFRLAIEDGRIVGVIGSYEFDVTLPGGATLPAGGVTWVSVQVTHRRQGLLRQLMAACHADIDARGEPIAMLTASEGSIYERFGYGIASFGRQVTIDRRAAQVRDELRTDPGSVWFIDADEAATQVPPLWDRFRRTRAGEVSRSAAHHKLLNDRRRTSSAGATPGIHLRHADGYACYRVTQNWNEGNPLHAADVVELFACTPDAHLALWQTLLSLDLVGPIATRQLALDDPLPYLLTNARSMIVRTNGLDDNVWVHPRSIPICFGARTYGTQDRLIVEAGGQRWAIEGSPEGAACRKVRTRPDLTTNIAGLGALLLGGVRPSVLAGGRRLLAADESVLRRADNFFAGAHQPFCQTAF
jgi:predicted acetyltransferase